MERTYETILEWIQKQFVFNGNFSVEGRKEMAYITRKEDLSYIILAYDYDEKYIRVTMSDVKSGIAKLMFETSLENHFTNDPSFILGLIKSVLVELGVEYKD